jgi:hypothetical protein
VPPQVGYGNCPAPLEPGFNICNPGEPNSFAWETSSPFPGGCNSSSWVDFEAVGKGKSGKVNRMELWVGGTKMANFPGDRISTSLIMVFAEVSIVEVDSKGDSLSSSFFFHGPC